MGAPALQFAELIPFEVKSMIRLWCTVGFALCCALAWYFLALPNRHVYARDLDGHYAQSNPDMHVWFDMLASGKGLCCSFADGRAVDDPDVDMDGTHYKVRVDGVWYEVPDSALVTVPNKFGRAVVWPYIDEDGKTQIRCFIPGSAS
jgi:hypothetical protein